ncbi:Hypothetical protein FKW44_015800, partial [Caligus rogercresseyi]
PVLPLRLKHGSLCPDGVCNRSNRDPTADPDVERKLVPEASTIWNDEFWGYEEATSAIQGAIR